MILYQNPIIYEFYGDEIDSELNKEVLTQQIIAFQEFDRIRNDYEENKRKRRHTQTQRKKSFNYRSVCNPNDDFDVDEFIENHEYKPQNDPRLYRMTLTETQK